MRASFWNPAIILVGSSLLAANGVAAERLRLGGTGGIIEAMRQVAQPFNAATGIELEVIAGLGSSGALRALADGKLDVVAAARDLTPEEAKGSLVSHLIARTPLVFITSRAKPNDLKSSDIPAIFASENPKWGDGTPLKIILRTKVDADTALIMQTIPGVAAAIESARRRSDVPVAATDQDNVNLAQRLDGSFSIAGLGQIIAEKCDLRLVPIDGVVPSPATLADGTYPYEKKFYLVFPRDRSEGAEQLLRFLRSAEGREVLLAAGNLAAGE